MKKNNAILLIIIVIVVLVGGGYAIFHKSNKPATTTASSTNTPKQNAPAVNNAVLITKTDSKLGQYLADPSGNALYTYSGDSSGVSNCTGTCLANWPAYQDKGSTSGLPTDVSTITRSDNGQIQYTYMGLPLYYFKGDSPSQVTGNGVDNFSVAKPASAASSQSQSTSSGSTSNTSSQSSSGSGSSGYPY